MEKVELDRILLEAKNGNELARERILRHYKAYILNAVGNLSRKFVTWSDDESSIGIIAFNRAIDTFDPKGGRDFLNYAYLLMKHDLIDYFRRKKFDQGLSLIDEKDNKTLNYYEAEKSIEFFHQAVQSTELIEEILELDEILNRFDISFEELEYYSPQHRDSRELLIAMAYKFVEIEECVHTLLKTKRLPLTLFSSKSNYSLKTIKRHRKYLITLILLILNPQWVRLSEFIRKAAPIGKEELS